MNPPASTHDATGRFSDRAEFYVRTRPKYPPALLDFFRNELGLRTEHQIADMGSGTGFLSELFIGNGNVVFGIEPNANMRAQAEALLGEYAHFHSVDGSAEATGLAEASVEFVVAGQAFHWFDRVKSRAEFKRILKPDGWAALVWNLRHITAGGFQADYDQITRSFTTDATIREHTKSGRDPAAMAEFFSPSAYREVSIPSFQLLDLEGVLGRAMSQSNLPLPGHPRCEEMLQQLRESFSRHASAGQVRLDYDTKAYYGHLA